MVRFIRLVLLASGWVSYSFCCFLRFVLIFCPIFSWFIIALFAKMIFNCFIHWYFCSSICIILHYVRPILLCLLVRVLVSCSILSLISFLAFAVHLLPPYFILLLIIADVLVPFVQIVPLALIFSLVLIISLYHSLVLSRLNVLVLLISPYLTALLHLFVFPIIIIFCHLHILQLIIYLIIYLFFRPHPFQQFHACAIICIILIFSLHLYFILVWSQFL